MPETKLVCPLLSIGVFVGNKNAPALCCLEEHCAWWVEVPTKKVVGDTRISSSGPPKFQQTAKMCAVKAIAMRGEG